jgi:hypothetical protein
MRKSRLLSTVAATLLFTIGAASAQGVKEGAPSRTPAAQQNAAAEKVPPSLHEGQREGPETTGQGQQEMKPGDHKSRGQTQNEMKPGDRKSQTTGQSPRDSSESGKPGMKSQSQERGDTKTRTEQRGNDMKAKPDGKAEGVSPSKSSESTTDRSRTTTGQGAAAGSAKLSTEQRTKITTIVRQHKVEPTRLVVSVRVGTRIPDSVRFHPLPVEVIDVYPEWRHSRAAGQTTKRASNKRTHHRKHSPRQREKLHFPGFSSNC